MFFVLIISISIFLLTGCGNNASPLLTGNTGAAYYKITESIINNSDLFFEDDYEIVVNRDNICTSNQIVSSYYCYKDKSMMDLTAYVQFYDLKSENSSIISAYDYEADIDNITIHGFNPSPVKSLNDEIYTIAWSEDKSYLCKLSGDGISEICCELSEFFLEKEEERIGGESALSVDKNGNIMLFVSNANTIYCFDSLSNYIKEIPVSNMVYGFFQNTQNDDVYWYGLDSVCRAMIGNVTTGETVISGLDDIDGVFCANITNNGEILIADKNGIWLVGEQAGKVYDFQENDYYFQEIYGFEADDMDNITLFVKLDEDLVKLTMERLDEAPVKQEITLESGLKYFILKNEIARFNRQCDKYHITMTCADSYEDIPECMSQLSMELGIGEGPDIIVSDLVDDPITLLNNGYLEYIDDVRDDPSLYLEAAFDTCKYNDKFYGVPFECYYYLAAYDNTIIDATENITIEELMNSLSSLDDVVLASDISGAGIVYAFGLCDDKNTDYIDWENGISYLDGTKFIELLEFAKKYADDGLGKRVVACNQPGINDFNSLLRLFENLNGNASLLGYPCLDGNGIYINTKALYLNSSSECKEGVQEFMRFLISEPEQKRIAGCDYYELDETFSTLQPQFPVLLEGYDILLEKEEKAMTSGTYITSVSSGIYNKLATEMMFVVSHAKVNNSRIKQVESIVYEELEPYFEGQMTVEEVAEKLDSRVQIYLDEQK